jgi:hypothetical protein
VAGLGVAPCWFFYPYDASATDVAMHIVAVALVIIANRALAGRMLQAANS